jgi:hypothetical protein
MPCEEYEAQLIDHAHGEGSGSSRREMAEHLSTCGPCAMAYCVLLDGLSGWRDQLTALPRPEVHRFLRSRVMKEFRPSPIRRLTQLLVFPLPVYQTALVLAVSVILMLLLVDSRTQPVGASTDHRAGRSMRTAVRTVARDYDANRVLAIDPNAL